MVPWTLLVTPWAAAGKLERSLDAVLEADALRGAQVSVLVEDVQGRIVYARAPEQRLVPASTLKWITAIAAARELGLDWRFETTVAASGWLEGDTLHGELVVTGSGDPTLGELEPDAWLDEVARRVAEAGIVRIEGAVRVDGGRLAPGLGEGWMHDDLGRRFSAPFAGLSLGHNLAWPATVGHCASQAGPGSPLVHPTRCAAVMLVRALEARGVEVADGWTLGPPEVAPTPLWTTRSAPLGELLVVLLQDSDNLYAECVSRALSPDGSFAGARERLEGVLAEAGVDGEVRLADGSGLSRYNLLAAEHLVAVTRWAAGQPFADGLWSALAVAGRSGTLEHRLVGTAAEGRLRGKTGSMTGVRNLVGEITDGDGERLWVAVLFTGFTAPQAQAIAVQDRALEILAISRGGRLRGRDLRALSDGDG